MNSRPTYRDRRLRYGIDNCGPQNRAVREGKIEFHALTKGHYPGTPVTRDTLPGLSSIGFWSAGGAQDWGLDTHRNEGVEITLLETGATAFIVDDKHFQLQAGNFTVTRPWQLHKLGAPNIGPGRLHWLILDVGVRRPHQPWQWPKWVVLTKHDLAELTRKLRRNENPVWSATPAIIRAFRELARPVMDWQQPRAVSRMAVHLNHLLVGILDALSEQQTHESEHLTLRRRTTEMFLRDLQQDTVDLSEPWTLDRMAHHCGMGITAFSKYCREIVNAGPMEYLNQCRLDAAARRLRDEQGASITDVAFGAGFNASQYFATRFRQRFGCSPSEYRLKAS